MPDWIRRPLNKDPLPAGHETGVAHAARVYDYTLDGTDHFAADRAAGEAIMREYPALRTTALENWRFVRRAVRYATRQGISQFLDIGTGIPAPPHVHDVAREGIKGARVIYADNDPVVLARAAAVPASPPADDPASVIAFIESDLRSPRQLLAHPRLTEVLDLSRPVGLILAAVLHFIPDSGDPGGILATLEAGLAPGSLIIVSHATPDFVSPEVAERTVQAYARAGIPLVVRTRAEVTRLLAGTDLVPPGVCPTARWQAEDEPQPRPADSEVGAYGAVGRTR